MQRAFLEWLGLVALLLALALWLSMGRSDSVSGRLQRLDAALYDFANGVSTVGAADDVVIIEIDDESLARVGRWPWPRGLHASAIRQLADARVIGLDVLIAEPSADDALLANAIKDAPPVVLPIASQTDASGRVWPIYPIAQAGLVASLGHGYFSYDADGLVRGLYLEEGGNAAFALALHQAMGRALSLPAVTSALENVDETHRDALMRSGQWSRSGFALLPTTERVTVRFAYADLLAGNVPATALQDRVVLIGAAAAGLGDQYSSTLIAGHNVAPGVDLHAAAFAALSAKRLNARVPFAWHAALIACCVLATMAALYRFGPRRGLAATALATIAVAGISVIMLRHGWWLPPAGTMVALLLAYPLWSWRRLEAAVAGLVEQAKALRAEPNVLDRSTRADWLAEPGLQGGASSDADGGLARWAPEEPIAHGLRSLGQAADRSRLLGELLATTLERLPRPAVVCDTRGEPLLRNRQARDSFSVLAADHHTSATRSDWLVRVFGNEPQIKRLLRDDAPTVEGLERRDLEGRDWLIDASRVQAGTLPSMWLLQFTDVSGLRLQQRNREEMMRFISHDLRSPQVSILAAIEQIEPAARSEWIDAIGTHARQGLQLADSFVQWTRAENKGFEAEPIDLTALVTEAVDASWTLARRLGGSVGLDAPESAPAMGDPQLLRRAIGNLIDNALHYGGDDNRVEVSLHAHGDFWWIEVADRGPGLEDGSIDRIFEPYVRGANPGDRGGSGLGLALVRMVAMRHGGTAGASNRPGGGAVFRLILPRDV